MTTNTSISQVDDMLLCHDGVLGRFLMVSEQGRFLVLNGIDIARLMKGTSTKDLGLDFRPLYPLVSRLKTSNLTLVIEAGTRALSHFETQLNIGGHDTSIRVFEGCKELVTSAITDNIFPVIYVGDLIKAAGDEKAVGKTLRIPVRSIELCSGIPDEWRGAVRDLFLSYAGDSTQKTQLLRDQLCLLSDRVGFYMVETYLTKCVWLDPVTGLLGKMAARESAPGFRAFVTGDAEITEFSLKLAKQADGQFEAQEGFADVLTRPIKGHPWNSPTLRIYNEDFRRRYRLEPHYSVYQGLRVLCEFGAPVLVGERFDVEHPIAVKLLRPATNQGDVTQMSIRQFAGRHVVWNTFGSGVNPF